jgi:hypothetical protein
MIAVIAKCSKYMGKLQMREMVRNFLGRSAQAPNLNDGAYSGLGALDNRLTIEQTFIGYYIGICKHNSHSFFLFINCNIGGINKREEAIGRWNVESLRCALDELLERWNVNVLECGQVRLLEG